MPPPPPALPRPLAGIAVRQEGLVSSQQCRRYGLSGQQASEAVRRGDWRRVTRGVFDLSGRVELIERHEIDRQRRRMAILGALAYPGAVVTGVAALVLHGVQGAPAVIRPEVTFPDGSPRRAQPAVRLRRLRLSQWLTLGDIALATVPDALAQAVPQLERRHGVAMLDSARHQLRLSEAELRAAHDRARFSPGVLRTHPWWDESDPRAESPAETWARLACVDAGIPPDALQLRVLDRTGRLLARVDLAWLLPDGRWLLVEIDGRDEHEAPTALFRDRTRQNSILTDRTLMRRYTGAESLDGTLDGQLTTLLRTVGWRSGRPTPDFVQLLTSRRSTCSASRRRIPNRYYARCGTSQVDILEVGSGIYREAAMSKTLIDIDDAVLERARELSGISTKKGVVAAALDEMVRRLERERYTEFVLRGELDDLADPDVARSAQR